MVSAKEICRWNYQGFVGGNGNGCIGSLSVAFETNESLSRPTICFELIYMEVPHLPRLTLKALAVNLVFFVMRSPFCTFSHSALVWVVWEGSSWFPKVSILYAEALLKRCC